jgi:hypothetical protein
MAGDDRPEEAGRWQKVVAEIMMSVDIIVCLIFLARSSRRDLTMPSVSNGSG